MDALSVIAPLVGVILGGALSGLGAFLKERREHKRTIAVALADLLEIRHRLIAIDIVLSQIRQRVEIPSDVIPTLRGFFESLLPPADGLDERYDHAVSLLAGFDPVLAFSLRTKNATPKLLASLRNLAMGSGADLKEFEELESILRSVVTPNINEAVIELAKHHSRHTKNRVLKLIARSDEVPSELTPVLDKLHVLKTKESN